MKRSCLVCSRADVVAIDSRLAAGESCKAVARSVGLHYSSVTRHRNNHLPEHLRTAPDRNETLANKMLTEASEASLEILRAARREGKNEQVLRAIDRVMRQSELLLKKAGKLREGSAAAPQIDDETAQRLAICELEKRGFKVIASGESESEGEPS